MSATLDEIALPDNAAWDWFSSGYSPVQTTESRGLSGRRTVHRGVKLGGHPLVIDRCWASHATVLLLEAALEREAMTLAWHTGQILQVEWNHAAQPLVAVPVQDFDIPDPADWYELTLRLNVL